MVIFFTFQLLEQRAKITPVRSVVLLLLLTGCALFLPEQRSSTVTVSIVANQSFAAYDNQLALQVHRRLCDLVDSTMFSAAPGKVIVDFVIDSTGKVSSPSIVLNESSEVLGLLCKRSILDPAPYRAWPIEMREKIDSPRMMRAVFEL